MAQKTKNALPMTPELTKALNDFPRIVRQKKINHKKKEKDIQRFDDLSKKLVKQKVGM